MFESLKFKRRRRRILANYELDLRAAQKSKDHDEIQNQLQMRSQELDYLDSEIEHFTSWRLIRKAERLDIPRPAYDDVSWAQHFGSPIYLKPEARLKLRQQMDAEITRRRDVQAWWWKNVVIPTIAALTGLAGVITGMIAVIRAHK